jgi:hypothetical protein
MDLAGATQTSSLSHESSLPTLPMDQVRPRAYTDPLNLSMPAPLSPSRPLTHPQRARASTDPIHSRQPGSFTLTARDIPPLQLSGMTSDFERTALTTRSAHQLLGQTPRPLTAPEWCESPEERVERNERKPIFCPTTSNSAALTASYYRKRQPAKVEGRLFTRYMLCSDYPSRTQHSGYSLAEDMYEDEKRTTGRVYPIHMRPSARKIALEKEERARSASASPQKRSSKQLLKGDSPKALSKTTLGFQRASVAFNDHAYMSERFELPKLGDRPLGDCIWMAWKLGNAANTAV